MHIPQDTKFNDIDPEKIPKCILENKESFFRTGRKLARIRTEFLDLYQKLFALQNNRLDNGQKITKMEKCKFYNRKELLLV